MLNQRSPTLAWPRTTHRPSQDSQPSQLSCLGLNRASASSQLLSWQAASLFAHCDKLEPSSFRKPLHPSFQLLGRNLASSGWSRQKHSGQQEEQLPRAFFTRHVILFSCKNNFVHCKTQTSPESSTHHERDRSHDVCTPFEHRIQLQNIQTHECGPVISSRRKNDCRNWSTLLHHAFRVWQNSRSQIPKKCLPTLLRRCPNHCHLPED